MFYRTSDGRHLMNLIAALKGQYRGEARADVHEADKDPTLAEEMKRKFEAIREKILGPRNRQG